MGRQLDLERLALGRSALQDVPAAEGEADQALNLPDPSCAAQHIDGENYEQQYDDKGRPTNPTTEARNQSMRNAQNAVLALVGVVESKEFSEREHAEQQHRVLEAREEMFQLQEASAENLDLLTTFLHVAFAWFPEVLVSRVQVGMYPRSESFGNILSTQLDAVKSGGVTGWPTVLFAGFPTIILHQYLNRLLNETARAGIGRLQARLDRRRFRQKASRRVNQTLEFAFYASLVLVDVAVLPIHYYAITQSLGLAPARPLLPSWRAMLPWNAGSLHSLIWTSVVEMPGLGKLCSPAVLILLQNYFRISCEESDMTSIRFTHYQRPRAFPLNTPHLIQDKIRGWLGCREDHVREIGAEMEAEAQAGQQALSLPPFEADNSLEAHRTPMLTYFPWPYLSERLHDLIARLIMIPWSSTLVRVISHSFLSSTMTKTALAVKSAPYVYPPFGGGPLSLLRNLGVSSAPREEIAGYANQLGLSFALSCTVEIGLFFIVSKFSRWRRAHISGEVASKWAIHESQDP